MPPLFHPFTPFPKPEPNGAAWVIRDCSSAFMFDDVPTFPKRFLVYLDGGHISMSKLFRQRIQPGLPVLTVEAIIGRSFSCSTYNRFSSITAALGLIPLHLFHVFALECTQFTVEGGLLYKPVRYGCAPWTTVSNRSVSVWSEKG